MSDKTLISLAADTPILGPRTNFSIFSRLISPLLDAIFVGTPDETLDAPLAELLALIASSRIGITDFKLEFC